MNDQDLPSWSNETLDDRLNNTDWGSQQKKANRSSEKNKKKLGGEAETRLTNDISPESSPGMGRRKTRTPHSFPHARYMTQMSVPEQAELERLKQRINFSDLDQRSIGSDSQGRATAANNKRQLNENKKRFNFLSLQINTNKSKDPASGSQKKESGVSVQCKELFGAALSKDFLQNCQVSAQEDGRGEPAMDSSQIVSRLVQIRDYIAKASSMRDDLVEKNERSANVERLSHLIDHLKEQEKSYLKFLQKMLARENEEDDVRTIDSAVGSGSVGESTSLNVDVQSEASDTTEVSFSLSIRPRIEDKLGNSASQEQVTDIDVTASPKGKSDRAALNDREIWPCRINSQEHGLPSKARDPQQEAKEELENLKKQHDLLKRMLQQQEQLKALQGRQAALLALQHKAEQAIAVMDDSGSPQRSIDQRSTTSAASGPVGIVTVVNGESNSLASAPYPPDSLASQNESEEDDNLNPTEKLQKLNEVRKRLNELRELVHYYEQTSDMMTDAVNENTKEEEETEESENCHNKEDDKDIDLPQGEDDEVEEDRVSEDSISSHRSSLGDVAGDAEFEQKINRLIAAKQKLRQLQNLAAMVQDDDAEPQATIASASNIGDLFLGEMEETKQQPNNVRASTNKLQKDVGLNEKAREKFYEAKLQQQQRELKQLQEERRKLIEIQEKIQVLQKACPDLQLSAGLGNCPANRQTSPATSTPAMNECNTAGKPSLEFDESVPVGNELWSEMRRHEILREELRQRRKQLEALMAEHQRRRELAETISTVAASVKSEGSEAQHTPQQSRTEKTMATWGGSTQCALDEEDGDEDGYLSDGVAQAEEEEEDASSLNDSFSIYPNNNIPENAYFVKENKDRWKNCCPLSADGNYRPLSKARQQQNISMRRQENLRWMSELSYVEEKEQWQEQINQLKKQHEFSVSICQTLMQDQQIFPAITSDFGINYNPVFPSGFGDFAHNISPHSSEQQQHPLDHNASGKTEYMAFPKPFESSSSNGAEKQRSCRQPEEEMEKRSTWLNDSQEMKKDDQSQLKAGLAVSVQNIGSVNKNQSDTSRRRDFDEESLESFSSMPDPVDPTTVTKTFKSRKASAQASLASKDKTPKSKKTGSDLSMFEALRDTIYSEVATLISQNESRPHFLIELFHELQLLNTDYLRQRALYALQETFGKNFSTETCQDCEQIDADNGSTMSTSSNFEPFATDDLGPSTTECLPVPQSSEVSAVPCPRIDTQQLDRQIKAIMKEVIPFLKDSLAKFAGRKLKDCGEDLLVEISEVLFNELAFFKLMQDLDNNSISVKQRCKRKIEATEVIQSYAKEDKDETETVKQVQESEIYDGNGVPESVRSDASDQEEDEESESGPVAISLSKAETQALTNYGSGEDENEDEEIEFEEGPVDVQTSLQASSETTTENEQEAGSGNVSQKSDEDDFVKVEDLPLKLAVYSEADLMKKMATEAQTNSLSDELLDGGGARDQELVGDAQTLKEPETFGPQSA
ncbi:pericentriolar material 1 protein [Grus japonensis]|uniref:Pericentriolar material 1 protein n=1 Tax=Grus japonensis TaxID=30415 RepID=A0ABC9WST4_GRUJA